jgi:hypothetical protein
MSITLGALTLPEDLIWSDEFAASPMVRSKAYAVDGSLHLSAARKLKGLPITLTGDVSSAWVARGLLKQLWALLDSPAALTLTLNDGRTFQVAFDGGETPIQTQPIVDYSTPDDADWNTLTVKLIQV